MERTAVTLVDCVREFNVPVELLDKRLSDEHIRAVSRFLQWRRVAPYLMLEDSEIEAAELDGNNEEERQYKSLYTWERKFAFKKGLIEALVGSTVLRKYVCKLLAPQRGV